MSNSLCGVIVMNFEQQASPVRLERAVIDARRAAGVGRRDKLLAAIALLVISDRQVARQEKDFLPIIVDKGRRRKNAGLKAEEASPASAPVFRIETARKDAFVDPATRLVAFGKVPPGIVHADRVKFPMFLGNWHIKLL